METITESEFLSPEDSCCRNPVWRNADETGETDSLEGIVMSGCFPCPPTDVGTGMEAGAHAAVEVVTNGNDPFLGKRK